MRNITYIKKHKAKAAVSVSTVSSEAERSVRLARVTAFFNATREQFTQQVATANARSTRLQTGVLAGPVARQR